MLTHHSADLRRVREGKFIGRYNRLFAEFLRLNVVYYREYIEDYSFDLKSIQDGILDYEGAQQGRVAGLVKKESWPFDLTRDSLGNPRLQILSTSDTVYSGPLPYLDLGPNVLKLEPHFVGPCPNYMIVGPPPDRISNIEVFRKAHPETDISYLKKDLHARLNSLGLSIRGRTSIEKNIFIAEKGHELSLLLIPSDILCSSSGKDNKVNFQEYKLPEIEEKYVDTIRKLFPNDARDYFMDVIMCLASIAPEDTIMAMSRELPLINIWNLLHRNLDKLPYVRLERLGQEELDMGSYQRLRETLPVIYYNDMSPINYITQIYITNEEDDIDDTARNLSDTSLAWKNPHLTCGDESRCYRGSEEIECTDELEEGEYQQDVTTSCGIEEKLRSTSKPNLRTYGLTEDFKELPERYKEEHEPFENESYKINGVEFSRTECKIFFATPLESILRSLSKDEDIEIHHLTLKDLRLAKAFLNGLILLNQYYSDLSEKAFQFLSYHMSLLHWSELVSVRSAYEKDFSLGQPFQEIPLFPTKFSGPLDFLP